MQLHSSRCLKVGIMARRYCLVEWVFFFVFIITRSASWLIRLMTGDSPALIGVLKRPFGSLVDDHAFVSAADDGHDTALHDLLCRARVLSRQRDRIEEAIHRGRT